MMPFDGIFFTCLQKLVFASISAGDLFIASWTFHFTAKFQKRALLSDKEISFYALQPLYWADVVNMSLFFVPIASSNLVDRRLHC